DIALGAANILDDERADVFALHQGDRHRQRLALAHGENARVVLPTEDVVDGRHGFSLRSLPRLPANGAGGARLELLPAVAPHCDPRSCCPAPSPDSLPKGWPARRCPLYLISGISHIRAQIQRQATTPPGAHQIA